MNTERKYMNWMLFDQPPQGFKKDKNTGSPLSGYDFFTNGKIVLNGQQRILVKAGAYAVRKRAFNHHFIDELKAKNKDSKQDPMDSKDIRQKANFLARNKFKIKLLEEIEFDLMVCKLEGWSAKSYVCELKLLIDDIFQKMIKK